LIRNGLGYLVCRLLHKNKSAARTGHVANSLKNFRRAYVLVPGLSRYSLQKGEAIVSRDCGLLVPPSLLPVQCPIFHRSFFFSLRTHGGVIPMAQHYDVIVIG